MNLNGFVLGVFIFLVLTLYISSSNEDKVIIHSSFEKITEILHGQFRELVDQYRGPPKYKIKTTCDDAFKGSKVAKDDWD